MFSLKPRTKMSSSGLLFCANATAAAITRARFGAMLPLLSISRPSDGRILAAEKRDRLLLLVFEDVKRLLLQSADIALLSRTATCRTTTCDSDEKFAFWPLACPATWIR